jgi:transaldolase
MTRLHRLDDEHGQSPWLDNLARPHLRDGTLAGLVAAGVRESPANPTILARAIEGSDAYDEQFGGCVRRRLSVEEAYWDLVIDDVVAALHLLRSTFDASSGTDGFVSIEVAPAWRSTPAPLWPPPGPCTSGSASRTCSSRSQPRQRACLPSRR